MKSSWKYFTLSTSELGVEYDRLTKENFINTLIYTNRRQRISNFIFNCKCRVYQGKFLVDFKTTPFALGYKLGQFTKTRKPFFFRSKKKKR